MTLEPVHMKTIFNIVESIDKYSISEDRESEKKKIQNIYESLNELKYNEKTIIKSIGKLDRGKINIEKISLVDDPFSVTYSCDSGSTTTLSFNNGLYVNFCHCAIASTPTNLNINTKRTIVAASYSANHDTIIDTNEVWKYVDEGNIRTKTVRISSEILSKGINRIVHDIALYLSESEHMLWLKDKIDKNGFFIIDGPIYPKHLMYWLVVDSQSILLSHDQHTNNILQNYIYIADYFIENELPFVGFVKNPEDMQLMHTLRKKGFKNLPWIMDKQFFKNILSLRKEDKKSNYITYTNWFMQPNQFYEEILNTTSPLVKDKLIAKYPHEYYSLCFFVVHIPLTNLLFKIEAPYGLIKNKILRDKITKKILYDISLNEIPYTLKKVDNIAKIKISERKQIIKKFKNSSIDTEYNDTRWGYHDEN